MKRSAFLIALIVSLTVYCGLAFSQVAVPTITFDDTAVNDTITVTTDGLDPSIFQRIDTSSGLQQSGLPYINYPTRPLVEFGRINFFIGDGQGYNVKTYLTLTEPSQDPFNQQVSDILNISGLPVALIDVGIGTVWDLIFESDYLGSPLPIPGFDSSGSFDESALPTIILGFPTGQYCDRGRNDEKGENSSNRSH